MARAALLDRLDRVPDRRLGAQIFIATVGMASVLQSLGVQILGPQPKAQPMQVPRGLAGPCAR